jgi:hypothetical protein
VIKEIEIDRRKEILASLVCLLRRVLAVVS